MSQALSVVREDVESHAGFFARLDKAILDSWNEIHEGRLWAHVRRHGLDRDLYQRLMVELYHYTKHNSKNQAVAAWGVDPEKIGLLKFCYSHAAEELGHEKMVEHDLRAVGLLDGDVLQKHPLPPTQGLIAYLYYVALTKGATARLGYSYWAESAYDHIGEILVAIRESLGFTDSQMTFFVSHQKVDVKHAQEVREIIERYAETADEQDSIIEVAKTTLYLTGKLLEAAFDAYVGAKKAEA